MDVQALLAPDAGLPLGQSRSRVLDLLRDAGSPVGVQEVAGQTGLHPNTARFHLDALVQAGLAARASQARTRPGLAEHGIPAGGGRRRSGAATLPPARRDTHQPHRGRDARAR